MKQIFNFNFSGISNPKFRLYKPTRFNGVVIAKPFKYLNYEKDYVSTVYLATYLDFVMATLIVPLTT